LTLLGVVKAAEVLELVFSPCPAGSPKARHPDLKDAKALLDELRG
jgi:hypothetical protein